MRLKRLLLAAVVSLVAGGFSPAHGATTHGIAMHGAPALPEGFSHFPHVNPAAPKGGTITLGAQGSFDTLNPLNVTGSAANGIREFVYESLLARSPDEPFSLYGLIAERVAVPDDRTSITFHLDPKAAFSDRRPVTAEDVLFSLELLRDKGRPNHRTYYAKVTSAERVDERTVRFTFDGKGDREMPLIMGLMPVLPKHAIDPATFEQTTFTPPVGSGPYTVGRVEAGRSISLKRDPDYWGRDLPVNRGRYNFDDIRSEYFREGAALFEAFKSGFIDLRAEEDPGRWHEDYVFPALTDGRVVKAEFETGLPAGMNALAFNTRRDVFTDPRVRRALVHLFDFEWVNRNLYHDLYKRTQSFFERSILSSDGKPAGVQERELLAPYLGGVKPAILGGTYDLPITNGSGHNRENWQAAFKLLSEAGYEMRDRKLVHGASGTPLTFEILLSGAAQERLFAGFAADLARLGITAQMRTVDSAQYQLRLKSYDFDMIQATWPASLSPGNEQLFRWSSAAAKADNTLNYPGVSSPAVDALVNELLVARSGEEFVSAVRALDRVLLSGDYVIPLFHLPKQWVAHWRHLEHPEGTPLFGFTLDTWWRREPREAARSGG